MNRPANFKTTTLHLEHLADNPGMWLEVDTATNTMHLVGALFPYWAELEPAGLPGVAA